MFIRIAALARKIRQNRQGAVAIQFAIIATTLIGMAALGVDIGFVYYKHREMQSAADAAASGAGTALAKGYPANIGLEARALAAAVGFVDGANGVVITVNRPPTSGSHTTDPNAVEVFIAEPQTLNLVSLFRSGLFNVKVRAVAIQGTQGSYCVLGLDTAASGAVKTENNGVVSSTTCGVGVNSSSNSALILDNNASIKGPVSVVGNWSIDNGSSLPTNPAPKNHASPLTDPFGTVTFTVNTPTRTQPTGCTICNLLPGHYTAGLNYSNNKTLNFAAGVYYIDTRLTLSNTVTVNATGGVTLVINGNYAISIGNNVTFNITAPTSGPTAGIAIASIRTATKTVTQKFSNNAILNLTGAIYFPNQIVQFDNNSFINTTTCGQIVARIVQLQNNANLKNQCGTHNITGGGKTQLVE